MDALLALVSSAADEGSSALATAALDRLWPGMPRRTDEYSERGVLLTVARVDDPAHGLPPPAVRFCSGAVVAHRWDWPALAEDGPRSSDWAAHLADRGPLRSPPAGIPSSLAWLPGTETFVALRDAMGEGSLWYAANRNRLAVASHPVLLMSVPWIVAGPDPIGAELAWFGVGPGHLTPWIGIRRLPAGHRLIWREGTFVVEQWWRLVRPADEREHDDTVWFELARAAMERAVARRIPATGAVGTHLSGGLDSTAVSLLAARFLDHGGQPVHTFSHLPSVKWIPPQPGDETPYVEAAIAKMPNAILHCCTDEGGGGSLLDGRPLAAHDSAVSEEARRAGVNLMLSGWGGDEGLSFNGAGFLAQELLKFRLLPLLRSTWEMGGRRLRGLAAILLYRLVYQQLGLVRPPTGQLALSRVPPVLLDRASGPSGEVARGILRQTSSLRSAASPHENQRRLLSSPHIGNRIDADAEWSIPAGFCFRYPLLDPEVIQVALQAPERLFVLNGRTRTLMREAMRDLYPDLIYHRRGKFVSHPRRPEFRPLE